VYGGLRSVLLMLATCLNQIYPLFKPDPKNSPPDWSQIPPSIVLALKDSYLDVATLYLMIFQEKKDVQIIDATIELLEAALKFPVPNYAGHDRLWHNYAYAWRDKYLLSQSKEDLDGAIRVYQRTVRNMNRNSYYIWTERHILGVMLHQKSITASWSDPERLAALYEGINLFERILRAIPTSHRKFEESKDSFIGMMQSLGEYAAREEDLFWTSEIYSHFQSAIEISDKEHAIWERVSAMNMPTWPTEQRNHHEAIALWNRAKFYRSRHQYLGFSGDINTAQSLYLKALSKAGAITRTTPFSFTASTVSRLSVYLDVSDSFDKAITTLNNWLAHLKTMESRDGEHDIDRAETLGFLVHTYISASQRRNTGTQKHELLKKAVQAALDAKELFSQNSGHLSGTEFNIKFLQACYNLSYAYHELYSDSSKNLAHLNLSCQTLVRELSLWTKYVKKYLSNLPGLKFGGNAAIKSLSVIVGHVKYPPMRFARDARYSIELAGDILEDRFRLYGQLDDLDMAIRCSDWTTNLLHSLHPEARRALKIKKSRLLLRLRTVHVQSRERLVSALLRVYHIQRLRSSPGASSKFMSTVFDLLREFKARPNGSAGMFGDSQENPYIDAFWRSTDAPRNGFCLSHDEPPTKEMFQLNFARDRSLFFSRVNILSEEDRAKLQAILGTKFPLWEEMEDRKPVFSIG
jgi:hypothetical protein